jgi:hypothetical protein
MNGTSRKHAFHEGAILYKKESIWGVKLIRVQDSDIPQSSLNSLGVGPIAQSVEQRTFNPWVDGSSPSGPT